MSRFSYKTALSLAFEIALVMCIVIGISFRFRWVEWHDGTNLHPDEYGLTNTLTQLSIPKTMDDYFNTRLSPISPYPKYDEEGNKLADGPDNRLRWGQLPIIIIRWVGETVKLTGYDELRVLGRQLSGLADTLSLGLIFLIGWRLYGRKVGLLAAALSSLAVMQIQQSNFMTVDNFGAFFTTLAMYACVEISKNPPVKRDEALQYHVNWDAWKWYLLFGVAFGMALACKINLLPVGGMILVAVFIAVSDLKLTRSNDLGVIFKQAALAMVLAFVAAGAAFRISQPMTFRAEEGNTGIFTLIPNFDWVESMKVASSESSGIGGGPPGEQWAHRPMIFFPLVNMVLWGMGLPLGVAAWLGWFAALWQAGRWRNWQAHMLPVVWAGGYFLFMGTRWVKSIRYFLPIYPFLALLAAWLLWSLWQKANGPARKIAAGTLLGFVLVFTLAWANAFTQAVYVPTHTRLQAARWIFSNMPGPIHLVMQDENGNLFGEPIGMPEGWEIGSAPDMVQTFKLNKNATLSKVILPHVFADGATSIDLSISSDLEGQQVLAKTTIPLTEGRREVDGSFAAIALKMDQPYFVRITTQGTAKVQLFHTVLANENWDESLPMPLDGRDPFGSIYNGVTMEVRWFDDENKRQMFYERLAETDYIILPSQRGIWSTCRIPKMYPMTMAYYKALFSGQLGFDLVKLFTEPFRLGPLAVSDVGGTLAWGTTPHLPLFNNSPWAAEEAFSVYDHPPVWIFKKAERFNLADAQRILGAIDLSKVIAQQPPEADGDWCPDEGK